MLGCSSKKKLDPTECDISHEPVSTSIVDPLGWELDISLESFRKRSDPRNPLPDRATKPLPKIVDEAISPKSIFLTHYGKDILLDGVLRSDGQPLDIQKITQFSLKMPDSTNRNIPVHEIQKTKRKFEFLALLDRSFFPGRDFVRRCEKRGPKEGSLFEMEFSLTVKRYTTGSHPVTIKGGLFCEMHPSEHKFIAEGWKLVVQKEPMPIVITAEHNIRKMNEEERFYQALAKFDNLVASKPSGFVVNEKYRLMPNGMPQRTKIRYATNINSGDHVVLKFYPNFEASEAAIQAHRWIRKSERVCKMFEIVEIVGFPPCIAFERGEYTLEQWNRDKNPSVRARLDAVSQILVALADVHGLRVVHCNLDPTNILFFSRTKNWAIRNFDNAVLEGSRMESVHRSKYNAPELLEFVPAPEVTKYWKPSVDMFSMGLILYEFLTGNGTFDSGAASQNIMRQVSSTEELHCIEGIDGKEIKKVLRKLLSKTPESRLSAQKTIAAKLLRDRDDSTTLVFARA